MFRKFIFGVSVLAMVLLVGVLSMGFTPSSPPIMVSPIYSGVIIDQGEICAVKSLFKAAKLSFVNKNLNFPLISTIKERWALRPRTLGVLFNVGRGTYSLINLQPIIIC